MAESKFADPPVGQESKFAEDNCNDYEVDEGESKKGESKFEDPSSEETALVTTCTVFGKDPIISNLVDFWGTSLSNDIATFFADNCHDFDPDDSEHKLHYTKLHKKYEKLMESHLQVFSEQEGITESEMYKRIRAATSKNELAQMIIELVLCCADYECFVDIMKAKNRRADFEKNEGRAGEDESKW